MNEIRDLYINTGRDLSSAEMLERKFDKLGDSPKEVQKAKLLKKKYQTMISCAIKEADKLKEKCEQKLKEIRADT